MKMCIADKWQLHPKR